MEAITINNSALEDNIISEKHISKVKRIQKEYYFSEVYINRYQMVINIRGTKYFVWFTEQFRQYPHTFLQSMDSFYTIRIFRRKQNRERKDRDWFWYKKYGNRNFDINSFCQDIFPRFTNSRINFSPIDLFEIFYLYIPNWYKNSFITCHNKAKRLFFGL